MTHDDRDKQQSDALEALVAEAFSSRGDLIPTTEDQVAQAEAKGVEFEGDLPECLRAFDESARSEQGPDPISDRVPVQMQGERGDNVIQLDSERRRQGVSSWVAYSSAGLLGAAAASVFWIWFGSRPNNVMPIPTGDPATAATSSRAPTPRIAIGTVRQCPTPCCAGDACSKAEPPNNECSSGRSCIPCSLDHLGASLYRLRIGSLALSTSAQSRRESGHWGGLEMCVRVGSSDATCVAAHPGTQGNDVWSTLPLAVSAQDLAAGFELQVRRKGDPKPLATWAHAVLTNPTLLCRGLSVTPKLTNGEPIGTLSVFLEDTHYVELGRDGNVPALVETAKRIAFADVTPQVYETKQPDQRKFSLVAGPLDKPTAERLRWKLLEVGLEATINLGADHIGLPREAKP